MATTTVILEDLRIPGAPEAPLFLEGAPLHIIDTSKLNEHLQLNSLDISAAVGIATVLYNWCPDALFALLDEDHWLSFTWTLTLANETKIEIGRIRNQVTFGTLDKDGLWKLMVTYDTSPSDQDTGSGDWISHNGPWIPNTLETMLDGRDIADPADVDSLGRTFARYLIAQRKWLTGRGMRHEFFVESAHIGGMDPWQDGIAMNPHWLYAALDLTRCTVCGVVGSLGKSVNRCGRCGTAAYCSDVCQRQDWAVHKAVCSMSMEDRGKALHLTKGGGLIQWSQKGTDNGDDTVEVIWPWFATITVVQHVAVGRKLSPSRIPGSEARGVKFDHTTTNHEVICEPHSRLAIQYIQCGTAIHNRPRLTWVSPPGRDTRIAIDTKTLSTLAASAGSSSR
nr:tudor domain-containing protein 1 [Quercus suber]